MLNFIGERSGPLNELQLETVLRELLDRGSEYGTSGAQVSPEILTLQASAMRLRAASQWAPLPEGRASVRRALLEIVEPSRNTIGRGRASWRRAGVWLSMTAVAVMSGVFALGSGTLDRFIRPSSPMDGLRIALHKARGVLIPGHPAVVHYALSYRFSALQAASGNGAMRTARGTVGGLPVMLTLAPAAQECSGGHPCGTFVVSLAGLSPKASSQFGELRGIFACESDGCTMTVAEATGVFAMVSDAQLSVSGARAIEGQLGSKLGSLGEWMWNVASAAQRLKAAGMLPAGVTASDLVRDASNNGKAGTPNGRGTTGPSGNHSGKADREDGTAGGSLDTRVIIGTGPAASVSGGAPVGGNSLIDAGTVSHSNRGGPAVHSGARGGQAVSGHGTISTSTGGGATVGSHVSSVIDERINLSGGGTVSGGISTGGNSRNAGGGGSIDGGISTGGSTSTATGGATGGGGISTAGSTGTVTGGATVGGGISTAGTTSTVTGGVTVGGGTSTAGSTSTVTGGATISGATSTAGTTSTVTGGATVTGGTSTGGASNASGSGSTGGNADKASGGASASGGTSAGASAGNASGGTSAGGSAGNPSGGASVSGGVSTSGGVSVGGSVSVGGIGVSGGVGVGGNGGGGAAGDKGSGSAADKTGH